MDIMVGCLASSSSIGTFSIAISFRNYSRLGVKEWESLSWVYYTLTGQRIFLVRGLRKGAHPDSRPIIFVDVFPELDEEEGINRAIIV